ncbi:MAG: hypothetical protein DKT66_09925 [Candidatus Melainabacteria bacterium]|nr:MAG: hypothetical protein DKT66_09925 [Candidatus Melainabacteria bacterium]
MTTWQMVFLRQMRVKLTKTLRLACSLLLLSAFASPSTDAFPFFHRKPSTKPVETETAPVTPSAANTETESRTNSNFAPAAPAFRPYGSTIRPSSSTHQNHTPIAPIAPIAPSTAPTYRSIDKRTPFTAPSTAPSSGDGQGESLPNNVQPTILQPGQQPIHKPPDVPERPPIPPPPAVQAPMMILNGDPTPSLSWRAVAYKLWITPESLPPKRSKTQSSFPYSSSVTMKALIKALKEAGWNTTQFSASAGHLLAVKADPESNKPRLIFAAHPGDGGNTVVRVATDPDSKSFDKNQLESILSRAQDIAARNDLL